MSTPPPTHIAPPPPPQRSDSFNFSARADAFLAWFPGAWQYLSDLVAWIGDRVQAVAVDRAAAEQAASTASAAASSQAVIGAEGYALSAAQHAQSAAQSAQLAASNSRLQVGQVAVNDLGQASVEIVGNTGDQRLNITLPRGPQGPPGPSTSFYDIQDEVVSLRWSDFWGQLPSLGVKAAAADTADTADTAGNGVAGVSTEYHDGGVIISVVLANGTVSSTYVN